MKVCNLTRLIALTYKGSTMPQKWERNKNNNKLREVHEGCHS